MRIAVYYADGNYVISVEDVASGFSYGVKLAVSAADWEPVKTTQDLTSEFSYECLPGTEGYVIAHNVHLFGGLAGNHRDLIAQELDDWGVPLAARIDALYLVYEMYGDYVTMHETASINANLRIETYHPIDDELDWVLEMSAEDCLGPTPASKDVVDALEKVVVGSNADVGEMTCRICLEEFSIGYEVTKMPCSHVFHGECIVRWLENRFVCPLCRFELPPEEETTPEQEESTPEDEESTPEVGGL